jgi:hypothetical protein
VSARGEVKAADVDVSFVDDEEGTPPTLWVDDVEVTGTRVELEEFIKAQIEEFGGLNDPDHVCKQGVDGHGTTSGTTETAMDWASYRVTSYRGEAEPKNMSRSVWVCDKPACVADAAAWASRPEGITHLTITHQPGQEEGTLVTLDSVLGVKST